MEVFIDIFVFVYIFILRLFPLRVITRILLIRVIARISQTVKASIPPPGHPKIDPGNLGRKGRGEILPTRRDYRSLLAGGRIPGSRVRGWRKLARRTRPTTTTTTTGEICHYIKVLSFA